MTGDNLIATCVCGNVVIETIGTPIASTVCYCNDCQNGSRQIEALPHAPYIKDADGGTAYILFRKDRVNCSKGNTHLKDYKLKEESATSRVVATCCNSGMYMKFDDARHWIPMYRVRFKGNMPPLQWRICTKFKPQDVEIPNDIPSSQMYPIGLMSKLLTSKISMIVGR